MQRLEVRRPKLYEEVSRHLEEMILDGNYQTGDHLPSERELMEGFSVSRSAIREALFHLKMMGLVELRPGARARVIRPSPKAVIGTLSGAARQLLAAPGGVGNFRSARAFFETGLARHAALEATDEDLADFEGALQANRAAIGNLKLFQRTDVAFHYVLAVIPRNPIFTAIHEALGDWLLEQRRISLEPGGETEIYAAHEKIFEAVAARDPDRAEAAMREHLEDVARRADRFAGGRPTTD